WGHRITEVNVAEKKVTGEILLGTNALFVVSAKPATNTEDEASITKRAEVMLDKTESADPFPYGCVLDAKRDRLYVSLWAQEAVAVIDTKTRQVVERWKT